MASSDNQDLYGIHIGDGYHWHEHGHMLCVGGAGQGKGTCLILPALLSEGLVNAGISVVVLDPKGENAAVSAPHFKRSGYDVHIINPFGIKQIAHLGNSRWNPFDLIEPHEIKKMCDLLAFSLHNRVSSGDGAFFDNRCRQYISLYMRYALHTDNANFGYIYDTLRLSGTDKKAFLNRMASDDTFSGCRTAKSILDRLEGESVKTEDNIFGTIEEATDILEDEALLQSMSVSDFDIRTIAQKPTAIFICIKHEELRYYASWVRIFTDILLKKLTTYYNPKRKVLVLLDEFAQLGYMNEFRNAPAILRGYNITLWPIVQELGQLKNLYGDSWETFISNSAVKHWICGGMDNTTAEYISKRLPNDLKFIGHNSDGSPRERETKLMEPHQIIYSDKIICEANGLDAPVLLEKVRYTKLPFASKNKSDNPFY